VFRFHTGYFDPIAHEVQVVVVPAQEPHTLLHLFWSSISSRAVTLSSVVFAAFNEPFSDIASIIKLEVEPA